VTRRTILNELRLAALILPFGFACGSTGVGNPATETGSLSLAIVSDDENSSAEPMAPIGPELTTDAAGDTTDRAAGDTAEPLPRGSLTRALIVFGSLRWLPCEPDLDPVIQSGPFLVDLLAGETRPPLPELTVPEGGMCGFDAVLAPARSGADVAGRSLLFTGERADGVRFILFADLRATLRVRAVDAEAWGTGEERALVWGMRPRRWASPSELAAEQPSESTNGERTLVIDADRHPLLFASIRARLAGQSALFRDRDRNGVLDAEERSAGAIGTAQTDD
jgi:hypothetical protein